MYKTNNVIIKEEYFILYYETHTMIKKMNVEIKDLIYRVTDFK